MGYVQPHPSLVVMEEASRTQQTRKLRIEEQQDRSFIPDEDQPMSPVDMQQKGSSQQGASVTTINSDSSTNANVSIFGKAGLPAELEHQIVMSIVERVIAMIRCRRGLKAIESFEQVQFLVEYTAWLRAAVAGSSS